MAFKFDQPYEVSAEGFHPPMPAIGVRRKSLKSPYTLAPQAVAWRFQIPDMVRPMVTIFGEVVRRSEESVLVKDSGNANGAGEPVFWRFRPLTVEAFNAMEVPNAPVMQTQHQLQTWMEELLDTIRDD